eukprot:TRINITY_DN23291_c0_g1_i1.p1 TRINITY_DN23291_c0_g1~~TRINITY_DN23291_c0_g1_i1.p1  ORF type:complete len:283 (-),score=55.44 TRINITY_DN23291_c0_g1_i1:168-920(-)
MKRELRDEEAEEDFRSNLSIVDGLCLDFLNDGTRYVTRAKKIGTETWKLSLTNTVSMFWEKEFAFDELFKHKKSLGLEHENFATYFGRLRQALETDSVSVSGDERQMTLTAWCLFNKDERQLSYVFKLVGAPRDECPKRLSSLMLDLVAIARRNAAGLKELKALQEKVRQQEIELNERAARGFATQDFPDTMSVANGGPPRPKKGATAAAKRKPGYSLINPDFKRRVAKGARFGDDDTDSPEVPRRAAVG